MEGLLLQHIIINLNRMYAFISHTTDSNAMITCTRVKETLRSERDMKAFYEKMSKNLPIIFRSSRYRTDILSQHPFRQIMSIKNSMQKKAASMVMGRVVTRSKIESPLKTKGKPKPMWRRPTDKDCFVGADRKHKH